MQSKLIILVIFGLALSLRLLVAIPSNEVPNYDALGYDQKAISIYEGQGYAMNGRLTSYKPPLYPFFLASIYFLFGHNYLAVRVFQSIIGALTCIVIYFIAKETFDDKIGLLSALIASFYIIFIKSAEHLLTENLFTFFVSLMVLSFIRLRQKPTFKKQILIGIILGLSALTRSVILFFPLFLLLAFLFDINFKSYGLKRSLLTFSIILLSFILTMAPWIIRNWKVQKSFVLISTSGGIVLYSSYCPPEGKLFGFNATDDVTARYYKIESEVARNRFIYKETFKYIKNNLSKLPKLELLKVLFFWSPFDWEFISNKGIGAYNLMYGFFLPFSIFGMILLFKRMREFLALYLPIIYFQGMTLIFYGSPRFRMPIEPLLIIFASFAILNIFYRIKNRLLFSSMVLGFFTLNLMIYLFSKQSLMLAKELLQRCHIW